MARFETLTEEEKADERNQGELEHYSPEALALREQLRDDDERVCRLLESGGRPRRCFSTATRTPRSTRPSTTFYIRLLRLVDDDEDDDGPLDFDEPQLD